MKKIIIITLCLLCAYNAASSENKARKVAGPDYIEIACMLSGGMKRVTFKNHVFTFVQTFPKKKKKGGFEPRFGDLRSFVEIQRKTRIFDKKQIQRLKDWIKKYKITSVKPLKNPGKKDLAAIRYPANLMIYVDSKEYKLNNYTITKNPQLQKALKELFEIAKEFTAIE
ncbi:MAG: hypothetical protein DRI44_02000 [Chlamydiae bacterium]|nr:MAG: hypothetical protein DRI44_02000 [Chlamydiota bacterium]